MALRPINIISALLCLLFLVASPVHACFGPKLFVGSGTGAQEEVLFAIVTLYIQEKTGVESTHVEVTKHQNPLGLLTEEKVDLVFIHANEPSQQTVFQLAGLPALVTGPRPLNDLQFTTVLPAIKKLNRLLKKEDIELLAGQVDAGQSAMSAARKFLMENRWI
jgi:glycine betaine/choline ABC-type transport system substrate-binding protein